jgi:CO/xanthine dehydrogenase Mo-binding subunit
MGDYRVLNTRAPRVDAVAKATGQAKYADDFSMPGMLHAAILQSPVAHARILHIDTSKAKKLAGVKAVVTSREAGLIKYGVSPARYDETLFAHDKVRYVGDEIAAVAAFDQATAQEALSLIKVDYEELPAVFDMFEAMKEGAPQIHAEFPGNMNAEVHQEFGDVAPVGLVGRRGEDDLDRAHDATRQKRGEKHASAPGHVRDEGLEGQARLGQREGRHVADGGATVDAVQENRGEAVQVTPRLCFVEATDLGFGHVAPLPPELPSSRSG